MKARWWVVVASLIARTSLAAPAGPDETHLADHALAIVLAQLGAHIDTTGISLPGMDGPWPEELWPHMSFGDVSARLIGTDREPRRFHRSGKTIWEELAKLERNHITARWQDASRSDSRADVLDGNQAGVARLEEGEDNVVASYVALHGLALQFANEAGRDATGQSSRLRLGLLYEAGAQAYLRAAFFAAHLLVPFGSPLWPLHAENTRRMHDHFRDTGLYVQNAWGDTWQTFGDEVLESHAPTYGYTLEASVTSLRELFLVFALSSNNERAAMRLLVPQVADSDLSEAAREWTPRYRNVIFGHHALLPGRAFPNRFLSTATLSELEARVARWLDQDGVPQDLAGSKDALLPTLSLLPIPVTISRVDPDTSGVFSSEERPQLRDAGYHDPELAENERSRLPWRSQFPPAADIPRWTGEDVSVFYPATQAYPPSFLGLRTDVGLAQLSGEEGSTVGVGVGLGYAWAGGLYDVSLRVGYLSGRGDGFLTATLGPRIENPFPWTGLRWIDAFLLEAGYVHDLEGSWSGSGAVIGLSGVTRAWSGLTSVVNMGPALELGGRLYVRKLPLIGFFAAVGFQ